MLFFLSKHNFQILELLQLVDESPTRTPKSYRQTILAFSWGEAKYFALSYCGNHMRNLRELVFEIIDSQNGRKPESSLELPLLFTA